MGATYIEVFTLLGRASDAPAFNCFGKRVGAAAHFTVDNIILEGLACFDRAVEEVLADIMYNASDFSNLHSSQRICDRTEHSRMILQAY